MLRRLVGIAGARHASRLRLCRDRFRLAAASAAAAMILSLVAGPAASQVSPALSRELPPTTKATADQAIIAINRCDSDAANRHIATLKRVLAQYEAMGDIAPAQARTRDDLGQVIRVLELELNVYCGRYHQLVVSQSLALAGNIYNFHDVGIRDAVQQQWQTLVAAGARCNQQEFMIVLERVVDSLRLIASQRESSGPAGGQTVETRAADVATIRLLADSIRREPLGIFRQLCGRPAFNPDYLPGGSRPITSPSGAPDTTGQPPGAPAPPRDRRISLGLGVNGGGINIPGFGLGTQFDPVINREVPNTSNDRGLGFVGAQFKGRFPLNTLGDATAVVRLSGGSLFGNRAGSVPVGAFNVAYTFPEANPATGTTGILAGATGKDFAVRTLGEFIVFDMMLQWVLREPAMPQVSFPFGLGFGFEFADVGHIFDEQSLVFPDVFARTKLVTDNYHFAPIIRGGVRFDDGNVFAAVQGYVKPGLNVFQGKLHYDATCGPCPLAGDRSVSFDRSFHDTRFSVKTGVDINFGFRITQSIVISVGAFYDFTSAFGYIQPPTTPSEQPAQERFGSAHRYGGQFMATLRY